METEKKPIIVVVGGAFGSESKGLVCGKLANERNADICVRTGSVNAGHTVMYQGKKYVNQQIPVGWVNLNAKLVIGAGAYIKEDILNNEVEMINEATGMDVRRRLFIDKRCGVHTSEHHLLEAGLHERMGSTGEGVMVAIVDKMKRNFDYQLFGATAEASKYQVVDTVDMLNKAYDNGKQILLEGTQGALLDFHLGYYPYVTSRQTNAGNWIMESGLSPALKYEVVLVCRSMPIRVAGNSGPMGKGEISWQKLARTINSQLLANKLAPLVEPTLVEKFEEVEMVVAKEYGLPNTDFCNWTAEERIKYSTELVNIHKEVLSRLSNEEVAGLRRLFEITTVTKKLRRIADIDIEMLKYAVQINRPDYLVMNFMNYICPTTVTCNTAAEIQSSPEAEQFNNFIKWIEDETKVKIKYCNTSPLNFIKLYE